MSTDAATSQQESWGVRLAVESRRRQGLGLAVADEQVAARLRVLCTRPLPPKPSKTPVGVGHGSGVPDQLDPAGE
jgi:hypothetical protein